MVNPEARVGTFFTLRFKVIDLLEESNEYWMDSIGFEVTENTF